MLRASSRRLTLTEFAKMEAVRLTSEECDALRVLYPEMRVEPSRGSSSHYDLTPTQRIGILCLPNLVVEVRPKIDMPAVLFLVSYACEAAEWFDAQPDLSSGGEIVDMLAVIYARLVERTTRRGLLAGYLEEDDALQAPRGRIRFEEQLRRRFLMAPPVEVRHDVFTTDILENRLLLAALIALVRLPSLSAVAQREVARAQRLLGGVMRAHFAPSAVPAVVLTRLNHHYEAAVTLARVLLQAAALDLGAGSAQGVAFLIDMNTVFEKFVRRALRASLGASEGEFPNKAPLSHMDEARQVALKPDLSWVVGGRIVWVGDAKYKRLSEQASPNADLYQMLAYEIALGLPTGTLIYAADKGITSAEHVVANCGKHVRVVALDLNAPPKAVLGRVAEIAAMIREEVGGKTPRESRPASGLAGFN